MTTLTLAICLAAGPVALVGMIWALRRPERRAQDPLERSENWGDQPHRGPR